MGKRVEDSKSCAYKLLAWSVEGERERDVKVYELVNLNFFPSESTLKQPWFTYREDRVIIDKVLLPDCL